jgi:hypothetical protein
MKFVKKPVVIEATQWFKLGDHPAVKQGKYTKRIFIEAPKTDLLVNVGDWIITGLDGEYYPCKPDIFEMTYKPYE